MSDLPSLPCHICGRSRPHEKLGVLTTDISALKGKPPGTIKFNTPYCTDSPACVAAAQYNRFTDPAIAPPEEVIRETFRAIACAYDPKGEFVTLFAQTITKADNWNFRLLRPAAVLLIQKYRLGRNDQEPSPNAKSEDAETPTTSTETPR